MEEHKVGPRDRDRDTAASRSADNRTNYKRIAKQQGIIQISTQPRSREWVWLMCLGDRLDASMIELASKLGEERNSKDQGG